MQTLRRYQKNIWSNRDTGRRKTYFRRLETNSCNTDEEEDEEEEEKMSYFCKVTCLQEFQPTFCTYAQNNSHTVAEESISKRTGIIIQIYEVSIWVQRSGTTSSKLSWKICWHKTDLAWFHFIPHVMHVQWSYDICLTRARIQPCSFTLFISIVRGVTVYEVMTELKGRDEEGV